MGEEDFNPDFDVCLSVHRRLSVEKQNQLDATAIKHSVASSWFSSLRFNPDLILWWLKCRWQRYFEHTHQAKPFIYNTSPKRQKI